MKPVLALLFLSAFAQAQQGPGAAPAGPPLKECGAQGAFEILCGTHSPEDLELTPDGKFLIVSQFVNGRGGTGAGMALFDLAKKSYSPLQITEERRKDWGDAE